MAVCGEIEGRVRGIPFGVSYDLNDDGMFDYACAVEVKPTAAASRGMRRIAIPRQCYAVFVHDGHISTIGETYRAIWNAWVTEHRRGLPVGPSLERHRETFDTRTGMGGVEIWIPLKAA